MHTHNIEWMANKLKATDVLRFLKRFRHTNFLRSAAQNISNGEEEQEHIKKSIYFMRDAFLIQMVAAACSFKGINAVL